MSSLGREEHRVMTEKVIVLQIEDTIQVFDFQEKTTIESFLNSYFEGRTDMVISCTDLNTIRIVKRIPGVFYGHTDVIIGKCTVEEIRKPFERRIRSLSILSVVQERVNPSNNFMQYRKELFQAVEKRRQMFVDGESNDNKDFQ